MAAGRARRGWFWLLKNTLNRATVRAARAGRGPFSLLRHQGRSTGRILETPLLLARTDGGFVAELTYGQDVSWYRNIVKAGNCVVVVNGVAYSIDRIEPFPADAGLRAFGQPAATILRILRRHEFRFLHAADA